MVRVSELKSSPVERKPIEVAGELVVEVGQVRVLARSGFDRATPRGGAGRRDGPERPMIPHGVEIFGGLDPFDLRWSFDRLAGVLGERTG